MTSEITTAQWADYLNAKTNGFSCPICRHSDWQTQQDNNGNVCDVEILDHDIWADLNDPAKTDFVGLFNATVRGETYVAPTSPERTRPASLLRHVIVLRCAHCGWVSLFDRAFVEEHING